MIRGYSIIPCNDDVTVILLHCISFVFLCTCSTPAITTLQLKGKKDIKYSIGLSFLLLLWLKFYFTLYCNMPPPLWRYFDKRKEDDISPSFALPII
jgi:hypothetical protein